ncbi:MAG: Protease HtpX [Chroococcopsis gigantea SAG 12.99]|jgi:Zn-dependent protease with chaperone function|nr:Protease HtpX [Chroococcopsis gigantea SAG 12.99]
MIPETHKNLEAGLIALQKEDYTEAIQLLKTFCQETSDKNSLAYLHGHMALARAYRGDNQRDKAKAIAQALQKHPNPEAKTWADGFVSLLNTEEKTYKKVDNSNIHRLDIKAGRAPQIGIKLPAGNLGSNLLVSSVVTIVGLLGMVGAVCFALFFIIDAKDPTTGVMVAIAFTLLLNALMFFLSPLIMDMTQKWLYKTRWVTLPEIRRSSPEAARVIEQVCAQKKLKTPKLGIIDDQNPTAFTYGSLPNTARLIVSQGLFTYLDDDEVATVYAHELGHIVHWDFAVMTLASTLVQVMYLFYLYGQKRSRSSGDDKLSGWIGAASIVAYIFYFLGNYLTLYLSRTREYFADHFASEVTGNPNGLARALVKIAYGLVEEGQKENQPSYLLESTRALGIYDPKNALTTGFTYSVAKVPHHVGRVFLWDLFNPWAWWSELNSTHPLTGKRVRALTTYAEKIGIGGEFNMAGVVKYGETLDKRKLYGNFVLDVVLFNAPFIGSAIGLILGLLIGKGNITTIISSILIGLGMGSLIKTTVMFPELENPEKTDVLSLMSNPYASPLRGIPVKLMGDLIGRGDAGYKFGSDLMLKDPKGIIFNRYSSRLGPLGNFLFGGQRVQKIIGQQVRVEGWFRRSITGWVDLTYLSYKTTEIKSYPRFWAWLFGGSMVVLGIAIEVML